MTVLTSGWAEPSAAAAFDSTLLSDADRARLDTPRAEKALLDWQSSRALKQSMQLRTRRCVSSLSHSAGHALCLAAPEGWSVGVDLERTKPRDVARLATWACSEDERLSLGRMDVSQQLQAFCILWTLKEAALKAIGLPFPAALRDLGLEGPGLGLGDWTSATLRLPDRGWQARVYALRPDWIATLLWLSPGPDAVEPVWHAGPHSTLPPMVELFRWHSPGGV